MKALILVDLQNDFMPGCALAVPEGDRVVPLANALQEKFELVVATQDWHPRDHGSFAANHPGKKPGDMIELNGLQQILWPVHCVQNTSGAEFSAALNTTRVRKVVRKGTDCKIDSYSSFFDNGHLKSTELGEYLKAQNVSAVYLLGLATDYCVKFSALDAREFGFETYLIEDACRGVNMHPSDSSKAVEAMRDAGVKIVQSTQVDLT